MFSCRKKIQIVSSIQIVGCVLLFLLASSSQRIQAHGELLIRIMDMTRQIKTATNNLASLYLERGELHRQDRDWAAAASDYNHAAQLEPQRTEIAFCRGAMFADSGQWQESEKQFDEILRREPNNGEALIGRARAKVKVNHTDLAVEDFQRGLTLLPEPKPEYFSEATEALVAQNKIAEALRTLDQGIAKSGPLLALQAEALELDLKQKDFDSALARMQSIIDQLARKENWLWRRGEILIRAGRLTEAKKSFDEALIAISVLPWRIQQSPPMLELRGKIEADLTSLKPKSTADATVSR